MISNDSLAFYKLLEKIYSRMEPAFPFFGSPSKRWVSCGGPLVTKRRFTSPLKDYAGGEQCRPYLCCCCPSQGHCFAFVADLTLEFGCLTLLFLAPYYLLASHLASDLLASSGLRRLYTWLSMSSSCPAAAMSTRSTICSFML